MRLLFKNNILLRCITFLLIVTFQLELQVFAFKPKDYGYIYTYATVSSAGAYYNISRTPPIYYLTGDIGTLNITLPVMMKCANGDLVTDDEGAHYTSWKIILNKVSGVDNNHMTWEAIADTKVVYAMSNDTTVAIPWSVTGVDASKHVYGLQVDIYYVGNFTQVGATSPGTGWVYSGVDCYGDDIWEYVCASSPIYIQTNNVYFGLGVSASPTTYIAINYVILKGDSINVNPSGTVLTFSSNTNSSIVGVGTAGDLLSKTVGSSTVIEKYVDASGINVEKTINVDVIGVLRLKDMKLQYESALVGKEIKIIKGTGTIYNDSSISFNIVSKDGSDSYKNYFSYSTYIESGKHFVRIKPISRLQQFTTFKLVTKYTNVDGTISQIEAPFKVKITVNVDTN